MWSVSDLYPGAGGETQEVSSAEQTSPAGPVKRGSAMTWLALVILFFVFRVVYEYAQEA